MNEKIPERLVARDYAKLLPFPAVDADKYTRGAVGVIGGSASYPGAPIMASEAASRCGAGYVRLVTPEKAAASARAHLLSIPVSLCTDSADGTFCAESLYEAHEALKKSKVLLVGPGMEAVSDCADFLRGLTQEKPCVYDADALNLISKDHSILQTPATQIRIFTPHEGEAARLLGRKVQDRVEDTLYLAQVFDATVLLKGPDTLIGDPAGNLRVVSSGGPELAKAGTGDVLGGMIASFLSQGLSALDACSLGAYVHGLAGRLVAREMSVQALMPEDIINAIGPTLLNLEA